MNLIQARAVCKTPTAVPSGSRLVVVNTVTGEVVEGWFNEDRANQAARTCNEHERRNDRPEVYVVERLETV